MKHSSIASCALALVAFLSGPAQAAPQAYRFTASNFTSLNGSAVPFSTVSGIITLDATNLVGIDLSIGGHTYSLSDTGIAWGYNDAIVGGTGAWYYDSPQSIVSNTDDFHLWGSFLHPTDPHAWWDFSYSVGTLNDTFDSLNVTVTVAAVPEPETYAVMMAGLATLGVAARRRRKEASS